MVGRTYQVKRRQIKKEGKNDGGKNRKKRKKKREINKTKGKKGGGEEDRMKNRKEKGRKKSWDQVFKQKEVLCCSALLYIGILVTSTTTGHDGSVVSVWSDFVR